MGTTPTLSILTPSYGYGRFIGAAIDSCASQGIDAYEHIVQDACSTDETDAVVTGRANPHLVYVREKDAGQSDGLNRALSRATGEWIGWLNADEYYLPGTFQAVLEAAADPEVDVITGDCVFVDGEGTPLRLVPSHPYSRFTLRNYGPYIHSCATFIRRSALPEPAWDPTFRRVMDWDLWLRLDGARYRYLPQTLTAFRIHPGQVTAAGHSDGDLAEFAELRRRHGIHRNLATRGAGRAAHMALKLASGGYLRQFQAASTVRTGSVSAARRAAAPTR
jgi:glycosyltransferase involved in cell wall biosynthesis